jgi:hypothetical protein
MSISSKIAALRALAERPGTDAEGQVARAMLEKLNAKRTSIDDDQMAPLRGYLSDDIDLDEFLRSTRQGPVMWTCACGAKIIVGQKCGRRWRHLEIQTEIRAKFKKGDRVYYNRWAYPPNCPAIVAAYVDIGKPENGTFPWAWISLRFDHLNGARQVPIFSEKGWHLSHSPQTEDVSKILTSP